MNNYLMETGEESKKEIISVATEVWHKLQNKEIDKNTAIEEISSLEERIKILKKLEGNLTTSEKKSYAPAEMAVAALKKLYKQMK